jgi:hypothetical protein
MLQRHAEIYYHLLIQIFLYAGQEIRQAASVAIDVKVHYIVKPHAVNFELRYSIQTLVSDKDLRAFITSHDLEGWRRSHRSCVPYMNMYLGLNRTLYKGTRGRSGCTYCP